MSSQIDTSENPKRLFYSVNESRVLLGGMSRTMFYDLVKRGFIGVIKVNRRTFVRAQELEAFVERLASNPS